MVKESASLYVEENIGQICLSTTVHRSDLLSAILERHGGTERWNRIESREATYNLFGLLFSSVGYPDHRQPTVTIDPHSPKAVFTGLSDRPDQRWTWTPHKVWIETLDGTVLRSLDSPRVSFADLSPESKWNDLHLLYFNGYATWKYLTAPFTFKLPGFSTPELEAHQENGETWRAWR
jgi:hypothetical protein